MGRWEKKRVRGQERTGIDVTRLNFILCWTIP
jgi:hypothetical protein